MATLTGTPAVPGVFDPEVKAYNIFQDDQHTISAKQSGIFNGVSGPSLRGDAVTVFSDAKPTGRYTEHAFHAFFNQPLMLVEAGIPTGQCIRNNYYFNDQFLTPQLRTAEVNFGASPIIKKGLASKRYTNQGAYGAIAQIVGHNPQSCDDAVANNDESASQ